MGKQKDTELGLKICRALKEDGKIVEQCITEGLKQVLEKHNIPVHKETMTWARSFHFDANVEFYEVVKLKKGSGKDKYAIRELNSPIPSFVLRILSGKNHSLIENDGGIVVFNSVEEARNSGPEFLRWNMSWDEAEELGLVHLDISEDLKQ